MRFLDSDVMIDVLRGYPPAVEWFTDFEEDKLVLPGYVVMELLSWPGIKTKQLMQQLYDVLAEFPVYWASPDASNDAMRDVYQKRLSHSLNPTDALIGHCAREYGSILYTFNQKHFKQIEGLSIEQPYKRH